MQTSMKLYQIGLKYQNRIHVKNIEKSRYGRTNAKNPIKNIKKTCIQNWALKCISTDLELLRQNLVAMRAHKST